MTRRRPADDWIEEEIELDDSDAAAAEPKPEPADARIDARTARQRDRPAARRAPVEVDLDDGEI